MPPTLKTLRLTDLSKLHYPPASRALELPRSRPADGTRFRCERGVHLPRVGSSHPRMVGPRGSNCPRIVRPGVHFLRGSNYPTTPAIYIRLVAMRYARARRYPQNCNFQLLLRFSKNRNFTYLYCSDYNKSVSNLLRLRAEKEKPNLDL